MPKDMKFSTSMLKIKMYALSLAGEISKEHSIESLPWLFLIILMQVHKEKGRQKEMKNVQLEEECIKNLRFQALVVKGISTILSCPEVTPHPAKLPLLVRRLIPSVKDLGVMSPRAWSTYHHFKSHGSLALSAGQRGNMVGALHPWAK